jgi:hypothetical protein
MPSFTAFGTFLNSGTRESKNRVSSSFASGYLLGPCNSVIFQYCAQSFFDDSFLQDPLQLLFGSKSEA